MITEAEHIIIEKPYIQHVTLTERRNGERGRAEPRSHDSAVQTRLYFRRFCNSWIGAIQLVAVTQV